MVMIDLEKVLGINFFFMFSIISFMTCVAKKSITNANLRATNLKIMVVIWVDLMQFRHNYMSVPKIL